ncbi:MAG: ATP-dependent RecD-like DNA helicase [Ruminococcaceae bacterium]|nr:ATP-dependent RecD-like DNA helicase [Oscillospiraceae bacterium]
MEQISKQPEFLEGTVIKVTFKNKENGYTVAVLKTNSEDIIIVGELPFVDEGDVVSLYGDYVLHPTYGRQFKVSSFEKKMPTTAAAILRYLSSRTIRGVGPATAQKIVERFGDKSLEIIENSPEELTRIKGITAEKAQDISYEYKKQFGIREVMLLLSKFEISAVWAIKVYKTLGERSVELITQNPYILCNDSIDFPFETVEEIAESFGIEPTSRNRLCAGVEYVLRKNLMNGHTCLPEDKLIEVSSRLLACDAQPVEDAINTLLATFSLNETVIEGRRFISLNAFYNAENYIAAKMLALNDFSRSDIPVSDPEIDYVQNKIGITLEDTQRQAVSMALSNGVFILTGGPGTGKTTTLNAIIDILEHRNFDVCLAAPTGRAAKRMSELTGREAVTLHRLLEVEFSGGDKQIFARNEKNPLTCEAIIIDEMSMVDTLVFEGLLRALKLGCRVIMVGDVDQLPSVGAGNILNDLIESRLFATCSLTKVFRQAGNSAIVKAAHSIIEGQTVKFLNKETDLFFVRQGEFDSAEELLLDLYVRRLPAAYGFNSREDIQILCPSRKTPFGTVNLNALLQNAVNPAGRSKKEIFFKGFYFRTGDKVMQIKNNYDIDWVKDTGEIGSGIFNGDIGTIIDIDKREGFLKVRFEDRVATYYSEEMGELEPAYAITVHKSQGSEFDCVIIPLLDVPPLLKYRNLLYTAVTRAKKLLVIIGSEEIFSQMVKNNKKTLRYTLLKNSLVEAANEAY